MPESFRTTLLSAPKYDDVFEGVDPDKRTEPILHLDHGGKSFEVFSYTRSGRAFSTLSVPQTEIHEVCDTTFLVHGLHDARRIATLEGAHNPKNNRFYALAIGNATRENSPEMQVRGIVGQTIAGLIKNRIIDLWVSSPNTGEALSVDAISMYERLRTNEQDLGIYVSTNPYAQYYVARYPLQPEG